MNLGILPENGTICLMEQSIWEAWGFQLNSISGSGNRPLKLGLGVGLGVGVPVLVALIAGFYIFRVRRRREQMEDVFQLKDYKDANY